MKIIDFPTDDESAVHRAAVLLVEGFGELAPLAWPNLDAALDEVRDVLSPGRIRRMAIDDEGAVLGWIGGQSHYDGHVWELHPLVVDPRHQRQGIGSALAADFEEQVRRRGGLTVHLGTDDETDRTSLAGVDLYPDVLDHLARIRNLRGHPFEFYRKLGYAVVGVLPDANGFGKPDIFMAKRVGPPAC